MVDLMNRVMFVVEAVVLALAAVPSFGGTVCGLGIDAAANRAAIQREIDAVSAAGGGRVVIPKGEWPCGSLELKSGVELHIAKGAVLKGSVRQADYNTDDVFPENFSCKDEEWSGGHLIYAYKAQNVAITGEGVIDGNGPAFFPVKPDEEHRFPWYKYGLKLHTIDRAWHRPGPMVAMFLTKNIRLEGVTLRNTPCWTAHFRCCEGLVATNVTIDADRTIANSDGFSIDCTCKVRVSNCRVLTGDDGFAIRASCMHHAKKNVCGDILIENCDVSSCCYGIRFGVGTGTIRGVEVRNCRFLESANGFGFTTAWRDTGSRNCYIEDIAIRDTFVGNCAQAFEAVSFVGDCRVANVRCENCRFEALLPCVIRGNERAWPKDISFKDCTLRLLKRIAGRDPGTLPGWMPKRENPPRKFMSLSGKSERVTETNCRVVDWGEMGALLLSFDDRNFKGWVEAMPLFEKYGARATFFVSGSIDDEAVAAMRKLADAGHTVGLHGLNHTDAVPAIKAVGAEKYFADDIVPQLEACKAAGFDIRSFAYPNCVRDEVSDKLFYAHGFEHVRGCANGFTPFDPQGTKQAGRKPVATAKGSPFVPAARIAETRLIEPILVGEAYHPDWDDIFAGIRRAAERKEVFSIISHNIGENVWIIDMKTEWLEKILKLAKELDLPVIGFDELPTRKERGQASREDCR